MQLFYLSTDLFNIFSGNPFSYIAVMQYLIDLHIQGGLLFMVILLALLIVNTVIFTGLLFSATLSGNMYPRGAMWLVHIGSFAGAWGAFSTILGFFFAFDAIQAEPEIIPFQVISGGMKVGMLTILYGLFILSISLAQFIVIKLVYQHLSYRSAHE